MTVCKIQNENDDDEENKELCPSLRVLTDLISIIQKKKFAMYEILTPLVNKMPIFH